MDLIVEPNGRVRAIYSEEIDWREIGAVRISRASSVEPTGDGHWTADMRLLLGPLLGPFGWRSEALDAERAWLEGHWLLPPSS